MEKTYYKVYRMLPNLDLPEVIELPSLAVFPFVNKDEFPDIQLGDIVEIDLFPIEGDDWSECHCIITKVISHGEVVDESIFE